MGIHINELIELLATLCDDNGLKVTISESLKGGLVTGISTLVGGLLMGRVGLAIGGTIGALTAASLSSEFKSVGGILREMPVDQRRALSNKLVRAFRDFGVHDVKMLVTLLTRESALHEIALREVTNFLSNEMQMRVAL